jgi:hypothetical protein
MRILKKYNFTLIFMPLVIFGLAFSLCHAQNEFPQLLINGLSKNFGASLEYGSDVEIKVSLIPYVPEFELLIINMKDQSILNREILVDNSPQDLDPFPGAFYASAPLTFPTIENGDTLLFKVMQSDPQRGGAITSDSILLTVIRVGGLVITGLVQLDVEGSDLHEPLSGIKVQAKSTDTNSSGGQYYYGITDSTGRYIIAVPANGAYDVFVVVPKKYYGEITIYSKIYPNDNDVNFLLKENEGKIFGRVIDGSNQTGIPSVYVHLYLGRPVNGDSIIYPDNPQHYVKSDNLGNFVFYLREIGEPVYVKVTVQQLSGFTIDTPVEEIVLIDGDSHKGPIIFNFYPVQSHKTVTATVKTHDFPDNMEVMAVLSIYRDVAIMEGALGGDAQKFRGYRNAIADVIVFGPHEEWLDNKMDSFFVSVDLPPDIYVAVLEVQKTIYGIDTIFTSYFEVKQGGPSGTQVDLVFNVYYDCKDNRMIEQPGVPCNSEIQKDLLKGAGSWSLTNYPNPFNTVTVINFSTPSDFSGSSVDLRIFDGAGRMINRWSHVSSGIPGMRQVWDGKDAMGRAAGDGVYFCEFKSGTKIIRRKIILLR